MRAAVLACFVVIAIACGSSSPSPMVADCSARYAACTPSSKTVEEYRACRAKVDAACLSDGGAP
jgi:hypothetical protein